MAQLLGHELTTRQTVMTALRVYQLARLPVANEVLDESRISGQMYEFNSSFGSDYTRLGPAIQSQWDWVWKSTPAEDTEWAALQLAKCVTATHNSR